MKKSMINPPINDLLKKVNNKYLLSVIASKRARQLIAGDKPLVDIGTNKPVAVAISEFDENKITFEFDSDKKDDSENTEAAQNTEAVEKNENVEKNETK